MDTQVNSKQQANYILKKEVRLLADEVTLTMLSSEWNINYTTLSHAFGLLNGPKAFKYRGRTKVFKRKAIKTWLRTLGKTDKEAFGEITRAQRYRTKHTLEEANKKRAARLDNSNSIMVLGRRVPV